MRASASSRSPAEIKLVPWSPQKKKRTPKPAITDIVWNRYKSQIISLYIQQKKTAEEVILVLEANGFSPSRRQLFAKLKEWNVGKYRRDGQTATTPESSLQMQEERVDLPDLAWEGSPSSHVIPRSPTPDGNYDHGIANLLRCFDDGSMFDKRDASGFKIGRGPGFDNGHGFTYGNGEVSSFNNDDSSRSVGFVVGNDDFLPSPLRRTDANWEDTGFTFSEPMNYGYHPSYLGGLSSAVDVFGGTSYEMNTTETELSHFFDVWAAEHPN